MDEDIHESLRTQGDERLKNNVERRRHTRPEQLCRTEAVAVTGGYHASRRVTRQRPALPVPAAALLGTHDCGRGRCVTGNEDVPDTSCTSSCRGAGVTCTTDDLPEEAQLGRTFLLLLTPGRSCPPDWSRGRGGVVLGCRRFLWCITLHGLIPVTELRCVPQGDAG
ncbi:hypothetical protein E2C01_067844 [Portunus trituberculatus]|uniref:Uncharacterized protein n=1 Tax=Portunus trituberculatus TaxID=210409 RepID=A0A5B7HQD9_PORTR|nr:hypothetical protein [Portunus trituberculatus]